MGFDLNSLGRVATILSPLFLPVATPAQAQEPSSIPDLITQNMTSVCGDNFQVLGAGPGSERGSCVAMGAKATLFYADQFYNAIAPAVSEEQAGGLKTSLDECKADLGSILSSDEYDKEDGYTALRGDVSAGMTSCLNTVAVFAGRNQEALGDRLTEFFKGYDLLDATAAEIKPPSQTVLTNVDNIAAACPGAWESTECAHALAVSTTAFTAQYGAKLAQAGRIGAIAEVVGSCNITSMLEHLPVEQRGDRLEACANSVSDAFEATGVRPDPQHFRFVVGPAQCLAGDLNLCRGMDAALTR